MKPKPKTTYVAASPQTWELIRAAYLSGLSAPTAAARFGVSVTALRKRAAREGWTKRAYASACGPAPASAPPPAHAPAPTIARADDIDLRIEAIVARQMIPLFEEPTVMARRALGQAQRSIAEGRGLEAARMVKANSAYIPAKAGTQRRLSSPSLQMEVVLRFSLGPGIRRDERGRGYRG